MQLSQTLRVPEGRLYVSYFVIWFLKCYLALCNTKAQLTRQRVWGCLHLSSTLCWHFKTPKTDFWKLWSCLSLKTPGQFRWQKLSILVTMTQAPMFTSWLGFLSQDVFFRIHHAPITWPSSEKINIRVFLWALTSRCKCSIFSMQAVVVLFSSYSHAGSPTAFICSKKCNELLDRHTQCTGMVMLF